MSVLDLENCVTTQNFRKQRQPTKTGWITNKSQMIIEKKKEDLKEERRIANLLRERKHYHRCYF